MFDQIFCQCAFGNAVKASTSVFASPIIVATFGKLAAKVSVTRSHWADTSAGSVWAKMVLTAAVTAGACLADTAVCRFRIKCTRHRCHEEFVNCCATADFNPA
ncbi:hypothetical protein AFA91_20255 [Mycolicibacterium goodii]|uniref:Uncharacterized protein n=1 Tax=Mycolicibacterium goodii TaxID=134601 RepID=A0A0K0X8W3_MYCGD|nr:hypothetical protein AFA91_20255 [Mycolicibacterium goodii]